MKTNILMALLLWLCAGTAGMAQTAGADSLPVRIDRLVANKLPQGSNVGICVYDLTAGKYLYQYQADKLSRPASTMKLLTTITALDRPESDEPFRTEVWCKGRIEGDTLRGDLYVVGGFDPEFDEAALDTLVAYVARSRFSVITGKVYGDVSMKDSLYWGSGWVWDDNPYSFQPYLSPLMLCKGVVSLTARPGQKGEPAEITTSPASTYYRVVNRTVSRTPSAGRFRLTRNWLEDGNDLLVSGNVASAQGGKVNVRGSERFFMHTFVERLRDSGVECDSCYAFGEFSRDSTSRCLIRYETPVINVAEQLMKKSDNLNAEAMLCRLGMQATGKKHVSADDGLSAIRMLIKKLGFDPDDYNLADGCGLSNYDYLSPQLLVGFLKYAYSRTGLFQKLYKILPVGGMDGTLKNRMKKGTLSYRNVHAKTGSYTGINSLAGYLKTSEGHWVAFAIMNQNVMSGRQARAFQDAVCDEIIR